MSRGLGGDWAAETEVWDWYAITRMGEWGFQKGTERDKGLGPRLGPPVS